VPEKDPWLCAECGECGECGGVLKLLSGYRSAQDDQIGIYFFRFRRPVSSPDLDRASNVIPVGITFNSYCPLELPSGT
jgi:hypothetical protein